MGPFIHYKPSNACLNSVKILSSCITDLNRSVIVEGIPHKFLFLASPIDTKGRLFYHSDKTFFIT